MKGLSIAFIMTAVTIFIADNAKAQSKNPLEWMVGVWKIQSPSGIMLEEWKITDDSTLTGRSIFVRNNADTVVQENIKLSKRNGEWYYIPTVANQNDAQPVPFKIIFSKGMEFIAENPAHDFPQRIAYRRVQSQLFASIEGRKNGKFNKQNFDYLRSGE